jgi:hypothetical protein
MDHWADRQTLDELPDTFWNYDAMQAWHALASMQAVFKRLSDEICSTLNYPYPQETVRNMEALIQALHPV